MSCRVVSYVENKIQTVQTAIKCSKLYTLSFHHNGLPNRRRDVRLPKKTKNTHKDLSRSENRSPDAHTYIYLFSPPPLTPSTTNNPRRVACRRGSSLTSAPPFSGLASRRAQRPSKRGTTTAPRQRNAGTPTDCHKYPNLAAGDAAGRSCSDAACCGGDFLIHSGALFRPIRARTSPIRKPPVEEGFSTA